MRYHNTHRRRSREHFLATRRLFFAHRSLLTQPQHIRHRLTQYVCEQAMDAMIALHASDQRYNQDSLQSDIERVADIERSGSESDGGVWQCGWLDAIKCYCHLHNRGMVVSGIGCYNRLLECLLRADQDDDKGHSSPQRATAAAPWLDAARSHLQRMDAEHIPHNVYTHYLLALANLRRGEKQAAYQQLLALSDLIRHTHHNSPPLTTHQWRVLFYAFARVRDAVACTLIVEDMEKSVGRPSPGMKDAIAKMTQPITAPAAAHRTIISHSHHTVTMDNKPFDLHSPVTRAPLRLHEAIVRPLDVVDPVPPALDEILGPFLSDYRQLIAGDKSDAGDATEEALLFHLRQCCASEDAEDAVECWLTLRAEARESSSVPALHLLLSILCISNFATAASVSSLSSPLAFVRYAERLHIQLHHALTVLDTLQSASLPLPQPLAILLLRALAYLPMPLPSANLASSSYFASLPAAVFLTAEEAASRCLTLYQLCSPAPTSPSSASSLDIRTRLQSLLVRAHVKHRHMGRLLNDSLLSEEEEATHTPLNADACSYLIYHHINLPSSSLEAAYSLFSHLLPSQPASPQTPPTLAVYYLACGELMRRNSSKARLILRECLQRWSMTPSTWLLDALVLSIGGQGLSVMAEEKEEDDTAQLFHELLTQSGHGQASLPLSLEALTAWCERRIGRWLRMKQGDAELVERMRVDSALAEAIVRLLVHPSSSSTSIPPMNASAIPLSLLTNLLVMMSSSEQLPETLLAVVQSLLMNDEYLAHNASDSAIVSALQGEAEWYGLSRTLAQSSSTAEAPASEGATTLHQFARFKAAFTRRPSSSPSHTIFLRRHNLSRIVRCIVYSFSYTTPPASVLPFLTSLSHRLRLDLDGYALHLLLFVSSVRLLPNTQLLYRMAVAATSRQDDDEYGYEAGSSSNVWSRTLQYAHLFYLIYITRVHGRGTREGRVEFDRLLARLLAYSMEPQPLHQLSPPVVMSGFLTDEVVWALLDMSLLVSSPSAFRQAVSALLLQHTPHTPHPAFPVGAASAQGICPLPRFATTLMRGYLSAARGVHAKGWVDSGTRLAMGWSVMHELCHRYFANHTGLTSTSKPGIFLLTQRDLLCRLAALSVDHNNLQPIMALYATITQLAAESPTAAQQLTHLPLFIVPIKAALLNGHKRKLSAVVKDMLAWDGLQHVSDEQVRAELMRCRLGVLDASTMTASAKSVQGVVRALISRTNIVSQRVYVTTSQSQPPRQAEDEAGDSDVSPIDSLPATSALRATVDAYRFVLSSRLLLTSTGLQLASQLFSDIYYAHVKAKRQKAERTQKQLHGEESDEERLQREDSVAQTELQPEDVNEVADVDGAAELRQLLYDDMAAEEGKWRQPSDSDDAVSWATLQASELQIWPINDAPQERQATSRAATEAIPSSAAELAQDDAATTKWADRQPADIPRLVEQLCDECVVSMVGHARALVSSADYQRALEEHSRKMAVQIAQLRRQQKQQPAGEQPRHRDVRKDRERERARVMSTLGRRLSPSGVPAAGSEAKSAIDQPRNASRESQQLSRLPVVA